MICALDILSLTAAVLPPPVELLHLTPSGSGCRMILWGKRLCRRCFPPAHIFCFTNECKGLGWRWSSMSFELVLSCPAISSYAYSSPFQDILLRPSPIMRPCSAVHAVWCAFLDMLLLISLREERERGGGGFGILRLDFHGTFVLLSVYGVFFPLENCPCFV